MHARVSSELPLSVLFRRYWSFASFCPLFKFCCACFPVGFVTGPSPVPPPSLPSAPPSTFLATRLAHTRLSLCSLPHCMIQFHLSLSSQTSLSRTRTHILFFSHMFPPPRCICRRKFPFDDYPPSFPFVVVRFPRRSFCAFTIRSRL